MKIKHLLLLSVAFATLSVSAQTRKKKTTVESAPAAVSNELPRPKLVVGIVIDQMRWDYLYRYYQRYSQGGFKRILSEGFSCENTFIPYTPTSTGPGHTCVYTGSVPALHGIAGNSWYDRQQKKV